MKNPVHRYNLLEHVIKSCFKSMELIVMISHDLKSLQWVQVIEPIAMISILVKLFERHIGTHSQLLQRF